MRIWKWTLKIQDHQSLELPTNAKILTAQLQQGELQLWALVDEGATEKTLHRFAIYGTGHPIPDLGGKYINTFQVAEGELVFHLFGASQ